MQRLDPSFGTSLRTAEPARFADRHSGLQTASAILAEQPLIVFVAVLVTALVSCIGLLALDARQSTSIILNRMVSATKVVVFLDPQTSPQNSETIGVRLKAQPGVGDIRFRPKEQAFGGVAGAQGDMGSASMEMLLPDAWVLSLQTPVSDRDSGQLSLVSTAEQLQRAAAALPGVESVRFDRRWITELDRWAKLFSDLATAELVCIVGVLFVLLFSIFFLASRTLRCAGTILLADNYGSSVKVFAYIALFLAAMAGAVAFLLHALVALGLSHFATRIPSPMLPWLSAFGHSRTEDTWIVAAVILVNALIAGALAARRR